MKRPLLVPLFVLIGCVSDAPKTDAVDNRERLFEPVVISDEDARRIKAICGALAVKEERLPDLASRGEVYTFSYSRKGCTDREAGPAKTVEVKIAEVSDDYVFVPRNGEEFGFRDVETTKKGVLAQICENVGQLQSPLQTSSLGAVWFSSFNGGGECEADVNSYCIHLQRGVLVGTDVYQIHTREWIKFRIEAANRGFFVQRKLVTSSGCSGRATSERTATLR
jgi:hypothetical protein